MDLIIQIENRRCRYSGSIPAQVRHWVAKCPLACTVWHRRPGFMYPWPVSIPDQMLEQGTRVAIQAGGHKIQVTIPSSGLIHIDGGMDDFRISYIFSESGDWVIVVQIEILVQDIDHPGIRQYQDPDKPVSYPDRWNPQGYGGQDQEKSGFPGVELDIPRYK